MSRRYRIILGDRVRVRWPSFQALEEETWWFFFLVARWLILDDVGSVTFFTFSFTFDSFYRVLSYLRYWAAQQKD